MRDTPYRSTWEILMDQEKTRQMAELRALSLRIRLGFAKLRLAQLELEQATGKPYEPIMPL